MFFIFKVFDRSNALSRLPTLIIVGLLTAQPAVAEKTGVMTVQSNDSEVADENSGRGNGGRISIPGSIKLKSRQLILDSATPKIRRLLLKYEQEINQLNHLSRLTQEQKRRRNALIRTRFLLMRNVVKNNPILHSDINRMANSHRYRQGVILARQIMNNPETYKKVIKRADPEVANAIRRNNNSLRQIVTMLEKESSSNPKRCDVHRMDALYKKMSSLLDNQVGALEQTGVVNISFSE